jgi:phosphoglycolate phosphatase
MLKALLLDLDGTLLDTVDDFVYSINALRAREGISGLVSRASLVPHISLGTRGMVCATFGITEDAPQYENYFKLTLELYQKNLGERARLYSGMQECITQAQKYCLKWGIVTNKYARFSEPLLKKMGIRPDVLVCPDHVKRAKPAPDPLQHACALLGCATKDALYVGDHQRDIECGRVAGSLTAVANWGYLNTQESAHWGADYVLGSPAELNKLVSQISTGTEK